MPATLLHLPGPRFRVATSPGWHPYLRRLATDHSFDQLERPGVGLRRSGGPGDWAAALPADTQLVHVVTTGRTGDADAVAAFAEEVRSRRLPVVLTVFELGDRDARDPRADNPRLELLLGVATEVTTLTDVAARRVEARWGLRPRVIGHPHVAPLSLVQRRTGGGRPGGRRSWGPVVVGAPLSATARSAPWEAATALGEVLARRPAARVELLVTTPSLVRDLRDHPLLRDDRCTLVVDDRPGRRRLLDWAGAVDVVLLPHRHATHSAWTQLCRDLSLRLVSVADESMLELGLTASYPARPFGVVEPDEVADAVLAATRAPVPVPDRQGRRDELRTIRVAHRSVYGRAVARSRTRAFERG